MTKRERKMNEIETALLSSILLLFCKIYLVKGQDYDVPVVFPDYSNTPEVSCIAPDGNPGRCHPASQCVFQFESVDQLEQSACRLSERDIGVCCPLNPPQIQNTNSRPSVVEQVTLPDISNNDLDSAGEQSLTMVQRQDQLETELQSRGLFIQRGTKEAFHQAFFDSDKSELRRLGRDGLIEVQATLQLAKTFQLSSDQGRDGLGRFSFHNTVIKDTCPKPSPCPPTKYRTIDGSCNNLNNPNWGKSFTAFSRLLSPRYFDGINAPRIAYDGGPLPSAREVSYRIATDADIPSKRLTLLFMQWGQFLDHDITLTGLTRAKNGKGITCCAEEIQRNPRLLHPACFPINIPRNDPFFQKYNQNCMEFVRSLAAPSPDCKFGPREQLNQLSSFIDGSMVYGSTENDSNTLRTFKGGKLWTTPHEDGYLLPPDPTDGDACLTADPRVLCFKAGDSRVNEQPSLTVMHTIWLREHNRVVEELSKLNPGWNDEVLFQEARRIVGAEIQHITYSEFLPLLLGKTIMSSYSLSLKLGGHDFDYDINQNPSIVNSFATAAFRLGHTLVQGLNDMIEETGEVSGRLPLKSHFFDPSLLYRNGYVDRFVRSLINQPSQSFDNHITQQLTNHLFELPGFKTGLDLIALNIQRGRDHGIPGYNEWREYCNLSRIKNFDELQKVMNSELAGNFSRLYRSVDDIDLFPAGISENALPDATLGPTFSCILAEQFRRLKFGDRFWYENGDKESSFREDQLMEIRKVTLARILCDNTNIDSVQQVVFIRSATWNPVVSCNENRIARMSLAPWRNEPVWV